MKSFISAICFGTLFIASTQVMADDASSQAQKKQMWEQCIAKQKATNSSLTETARETICKNELNKDKLQKDGNDLTSGPQTTPGKN